MITSYIVRASSPSLPPSVSASAVSWHVAIDRKLSTIFIVIPAPGPPHWITLLPIASSSGWARARSAGVPPTMNRLSPRSAWAGERPTPASTQPIPLPASAAAKRRLASGSIVLMSTCIWPLRPLRIISAKTTSTSGVLGSIVTTMSLAATTSAMLAAGVAPRCARMAVRSAIASCATSAKPFDSSDPAMGLPMMPSPMNPTRSLPMCPSPPVVCQPMRSKRQRRERLEDSSKPSPEKRSAGRWRQGPVGGVVVA